MKTTKVLMVCLGNICRSPLAQGILESKVLDRKIIVDSAGTGDWHIGKSPDPRSIIMGKIKGIDITNQRARQFQVLDFDQYDYIYVMDKSNYQNVIALATNENQKQKVMLILNEAYPNKNLEVPDPYYGGNDGFTEVYNLLDNACNHIIKKIENA